jgi:hypothetical protein
MKRLQKFNNDILDVVTLQNLTPAQILYLNDEHRIIYNPSGRRSRKTMLGMRKDIDRALDVPGTYLCTAPTHKQAKAIFWKKLIAITKALGIAAGKPNKTDREIPIISTGGESILKIAGLDKPERIEGAAISGIHCTEIPDTKREMWFEHIRPMLSDEQTGRPIWAILDGTFDSRADWWTDMIEEASGGVIGIPTKGHPVIIENPSNPEEIVYNWHSADVLPEAEMIKLETEYEHNLFLQEFGGVPMRDGHRVYYAYSKANNTDLTFDPSRETHLSFDFNVDPMTCTVWQTIILDGIQTRHCVYEFTDYDSSVPKITPKIIKWLKSQNFNPTYGQLTLTGDHSATSRNHVSTKSAWHTLKEIFQIEKMIAETYTRRTRSGGLRDGQNTLNSRFAPYNAKPIYYINQTLCPKTHVDIMKLKRKDNMQQDDESGKRGHLSDTVRYMCYNFDRLEIETILTSGT